LLEAQGVVRRDGFAVAFRHSLVQRAIAAGFAATADARRLHLAIAEALLATPDGASPKRGRDVAVHLIHAGEPDRALPLVLASAAHRESLGETPRAFDEYGMALRILTDVPDAPRTARLDVHVGVGRTALAMGRGRVAAEHYLKALEIEETGDAHLGLGRAAEASGDYAVALDHLDRARSMFEAAGRPTGAAEALFWVGRIHERQGDFAASRTARQESIVRFEAAGDAVGAAIAQLDLGHMEAAYLRDFTAGLALLAQATHVAEEAGDPALLARCHQSTASAQTEAEMYEEAVEGYRKANLHWVRAGAMPRLAACLLGWGTTLAYQERADEGHVLLEAALRLREDMGDPHGVAACRVNLAMACRVAGHFEEAVEWARGAVAMALPLQSATIAAYGRSELGLALIRLGSLDEAESLLTAVLADPWAARAIGGDCLDGLGQIALARGSLVDARRLWAEAADAWAAAGWPRFAAAVRAKLVTHGSPGDTSGS
jgi:tetratricopeptide (TPR) repeat protein